MSFFWSPVPSVLKTLLVDNYPSPVSGTPDINTLAWWLSKEVFMLLLTVDEGVRVKGKKSWRENWCSFTGKPVSSIIAKKSDLIRYWLRKYMDCDKERWYKSLVKNQMWIKKKSKFKIDKKRLNVLCFGTSTALFRTPVKLFKL